MEVTTFKGILIEAITDHSYKVRLENGDEFPVSSQSFELIDNGYIKAGDTVSILNRNSHIGSSKIGSYCVIQCPCCNMPSSIYHLH